MRKLVLLLWLVAAASSLASAYESAAGAQVTMMADAEVPVARPFEIPSGTTFSAPTSSSEFLPLLAQAAGETHVNVFRVSLGYTRQNVAEIIQFALLSGPTRLFSSFGLRKGHWLTPVETRRGASFLATAPTGSPDQVGRLAKVAGGPIIEIRPLGTAFQSLPFAGGYSVEAPDTSVANHFLEVFARAVDHRLGLGGPAAYTASSFLPGPGGAAIPPAAYGVPAYVLVKLLNALRIGLAVMLVIVLLYRSLSRAQEMAVLRLGGLSPARIWWRVTGRFVLAVSAASLAAVAAGAAVLADGTSGLVNRALSADAVTCGVLLAASGVVGVYAARLRVAEGLKRRTHTGVVLGINLVVKVGVLAAAALISLGSWATAAGALARLDLVRSWSAQAPAFTHYGVLTARVGHSYMEATQGALSESYVMGQWLYPYLDQRGALFVAASDYEPGHPQGTWTQLPTMTVNRNYLDAFPIETPAHTRVHIPETSAWVVLVPERYRSQAAAILRQISLERVASYQGPPFPVPDRVRHQRIELVWIANQPLQSLDTAVAPSRDNMISDPIVQVMTLDNSTPSDRAAIGGINNPLKVRIGAGAPQTYAAIAPELATLHLADQLTGLQTISGTETAVVAQARLALWAEVGVALACLVAGLFLASACISVVFARYNRRFLVRRLFGLGIVRCYREWGIALAATLLAELGVCMLALLVQASGPQPPGTSTMFGTNAARLVVIAIAFGIVEVTVSACAIMRRERRVVAAALKEGN